MKNSEILETRIADAISVCTAKFKQLNNEVIIAASTGKDYTGLSTLYTKMGETFIALGYEIDAILEQY